jgi:uncharacterized membrane protein
MKQSCEWVLGSKALLAAALLTLCMMPAFAHALELDYYGVETSITEDQEARTTLNLRFSEPVNSSDFMLDFRAGNLTAETSADSVDCIVSEGPKSRVTCAFTGMTKSTNLLQLTFATTDGFSSVFGKVNFTANYAISLPPKEATFLIKIPKNSMLSEEPTNQSYSPGDGKILSDGRNIMVYWERTNAKDDMRFSVSYATQVLNPIYNNMLVIIVAGVVIFSMIAVAFYLRRGLGGESAAEVLASVLNSDEKKVVDILVRHGGKSGQKVIVRESDFSKAKVSRLVKNLKERGVVDIEPISGRENRIILKFERKPEDKPQQMAEQKPERPKDPVLETESYNEEEIS